MAPVTLTPHEQKYLIAALQCLIRDQKLKIDYEKFASLLDLTNPRSAASGWSKVWKKVTAGAELNTSDKPKKAIASKKKSAPVNVKGKKAGAVVKQEVNDDDDDDDEEMDMDEDEKGAGIKTEPL